MCRAPIFVRARSGPRCFPSLFSLSARTGRGSRPPALASHCLGITCFERSSYLSHLAAWAAERAWKYVAQNKLKVTYELVTFVVALVVLSEKLGIFPFRQ